MTPPGLSFTRAQRPAGARWRWPAVFPGPAVRRGRAGSRRELRLRAGRGLLRRELSSGSHQRGGGSRLPGATHAGRPRGDAAGGLALPPAPGPAAAANAWAWRGTAPRRCRWSRHLHVAPDRAFLFRGCPSVPLPHGFLEFSGALWVWERSQLAPTAASGSLSSSCTGQRLRCILPTCSWSIHPAGSAWPCCRDSSLPFQRVVPTVFPNPSAAWGCKSRQCGAGDAGPWECSPPTSHTQRLSQLGQHPVDSGDPAGPGAADTQGDRQQQRAKADAEHQRRFPVAENPHPAHGRGEAQQGELGLWPWVTWVSVPHLVLPCTASGAMPGKGKVGVVLAAGKPQGRYRAGGSGRDHDFCLTTPRLSRRRPSSSRRRSTSSPWSRRRPGYCSRTPSSSGSSRCCPGRCEGTVPGAGEGTVPAAWGPS